MPVVAGRLVVSFEYFRHRSEAELLNTFWLVSWDQRSWRNWRPWKKIEPWSVTWLTLSEKQQQKSIKRLFEKIEVRQEPVTVILYSKSLSVKHFFRFAILRPNFQKTYTVNNAKRWAIPRVRKRFMQKFRILKIANTRQQNVKKRRFSNHLCLVY